MPILFSPLTILGKKSVHVYILYNNTYFTKTKTHHCCISEFGSQLWLQKRASLPCSVPSITWYDIPYLANLCDPQAYFCPRSPYLVRVDGYMIQVHCRFALLGQVNAALTLSRTNLLAYIHDHKGAMLNFLVGKQTPSLCVGLFKKTIFYKNVSVCE